MEGSGAGRREERIGRERIGPTERVFESGCHAGIGRAAAVVARTARGSGATKPLSLSGAQRRRPQPPSGALALGQHDMSPPIGQKLPGSGAATATRDGAKRAKRRMAAIRRIGREYMPPPCGCCGSLRNA